MIQEGRETEGRGKQRKREGVTRLLPGYCNITHTALAHFASGIQKEEKKMKQVIIVDSFLVFQRV